MLLQVKEDIIRIKSVSILKDVSKMMNEHFLVGEKKKLWESKYLHGLKWLNKAIKWKIYAPLIWQYSETCGILLHLNIRQYHI